MKRLFPFLFLLLLACPPEEDPYPIDSFGLPPHPKANVFNQRVAILADTVEALQTRFITEHGRYFQGLLSWPDTTDLDDNYSNPNQFPFDENLCTDNYCWLEFGISKAKMAQAFNFAQPVCPILKIDIWGSDQAQGYVASLFIKVEGVPYLRQMSKQIDRNLCLETPRAVTDWEEITLADSPF